MGLFAAIVEQENKRVCSAKGVFEAKLRQWIGLGGGRFMKFLYSTDLHGDRDKYNALFNLAKNLEIKTLHIGADFLPKGGCNLYKGQKNFIQTFFKKWLSKCEDQGIDVLVFFGNDDVYTNKDLFRKHHTLLDEVPYEKDGLIFKAYGYVPDYPFGLKSACKLDFRGWTRPSYISEPVEVESKGKIYRIPDIKKYFEDKTTIEDDVEPLEGGDNVIYSFHCPPYGLDLDVCYSGKRVGSKSIHHWIWKKQPLLVLCGHIHESYTKSGVWKNCVKESMVIQPGQGKELAFVEIEIDGKNVQTAFHTIDILKLM